MKAISLFSSAGIGNMYLKKVGIDVVVANELLEKRAKFYKEMNPNANVIVGSIQDDEIKNQIKSAVDKDVQLMIATPPCQGMSLIGKNKNEEDLVSDERNYLIFDALEILDHFKFNYVLIENVPRFLKLYYPFKNEFLQIEELLEKKYGDEYEIKAEIFNVKDYGVAQSRPRAVIRMYKKGLNWNDPEKTELITIEEAIGHLPSLEAGESSDIKYHYARNHIERHIEVMKYTPTGKSAFENKVYFPKKANGERAKGFVSTYARMSWDRPSPAITMRSDAISSQQNVHPGRKQKDGTYSDARVLTLREILILFSIDPDIELPEWVTDTFMRQIIGEGVPPLFMNKLMEGIE